MTLTSRVLTTLGIGAAALALTGCSTDLHPGNAAVVDGTSISQGQIDDLTGAVCSYVVGVNQQGGQPQDLGIADLKSSLTSTVVQFEITRHVADQLGLTVSQAQVDAQTARFGLPTGLDASDQKLVEGYFDEAAEATILQAVIGAHLKDERVTSGTDVTQEQIDANKPFMDTYFEKANVDINPSYGTWNGKSIDPGTGSLSVQVDTPTASLPATQKCS